MNEITLITKINKLNNLIHEINHLSTPVATRHMATVSPYQKLLSECKALAVEIDNMMGSNIASRFDTKEHTTFEPITPDNIYLGTQGENDEATL